MIEQTTIEALAQARVDDAEILFQDNRYDSAIYLCGYAVELALKARICRTLNWPEFPETRGEFRDFQSFRTHDLAVLLRLSGIETEVVSQKISEWSVALGWQPDLRYRAIGTTTHDDAQDMLDAVRNLLRVIL